MKEAMKIEKEIHCRNCGWNYLASIDDDAATTIMCPVCGGIAAELIIKDGVIIGLFNKDNNDNR